MWPYAAISVFPEKGSGIFWYNRFKNNDPDVSTGHTACPILLGNKWIGNKWVSYNAQWNGTKCALSPYTQFQPLDPYVLSHSRM